MWLVFENKAAGKADQVTRWLLTATVPRLGINRVERQYINIFFNILMMVIVSKK
jgi:hypothetical protein